MPNQYSQRASLDSSVANWGTASAMPEIRNRRRSSMLAAVVVSIGDSVRSTKITKVLCRVLDDEGAHLHLKHSKL